VSIPFANDVAIIPDDLVVIFNIRRQIDVWEIFRCFRIWNARQGDIALKSDICRSTFNFWDVAMTYSSRDLEHI